MPYFTLVAWSESESHSVLQNIAALADQHVATAGDDIYVPEKVNHLAGYYGLGATLSRGQLTSPSLRCVAPIDIDPVDIGATPTSRPPFHDLMYTPVQLATNEALNFLTDNQAAERNYGLVWLSSGPIDRIQSQERSVRCTGTTTVTANAWSLVPLVYPTTLASGKYQLVGMWAHSSTCVAARVVVPNFCYRPGTIGANTSAEINPDRHRHGASGVWCEFDSRSPPQAEFLCTAADTSEEVVLDIAKIG